MLRNLLTKRKVIVASAVIALVVAGTMAGLARPGKAQDPFA